MISCGHSVTYFWSQTRQLTFSLWVFLYKCRRLEFSLIFHVKGCEWIKMSLRTNYFSYGSSFIWSNLWFLVVILWQMSDRTQGNLLFHFEYFYINAGGLNFLQFSSSRFANRSKFVLGQINSAMAAPTFDPFYDIMWSFCDICLIENKATFFFTWSFSIWNKAAWIFFNFSRLGLRIYQNLS
jgi:hypothetical protein